MSMLVFEGSILWYVESGWVERIVIGLIEFYLFSYSWFVGVGVGMFMDIVVWIICIEFIFVGFFVVMIVVLF